jgi:hypothetical protein
MYFYSRMQWECSVIILTIIILDQNTSLLQVKLHFVHIMNSSKMNGNR